MRIHHIAWLAPVSEIRFHRLPVEGKLIGLHRPILNMQVWNGSRRHRPKEFHNTTVLDLAQKRKEIAEISPAYLHNIEAERVRDALPEETLRKIERASGLDFGVRFDEVNS